MLIKSTYRDNEKEQFIMEVISENEEEYFVRLLPEYQSQFQEKDSITPLRKCLVGENNLYKIIHEEKIEQLSLFN